MKEKSVKVNDVISEMMRRTGAALTPAQRRENGRKAWATRLANLKAKLAVSAK